MMIVLRPNGMQMLMENPARPSVPDRRSERHNVLNHRMSLSSTRSLA
jgi:hypothetical protein